MTQKYNYSFDLSSIFQEKDEDTSVETPSTGLVPKPAAKPVEATDDSTDPMSFMPKFTEFMGATYDRAIQRHQDKTSNRNLYKDKAFEDFLGGTGDIGTLLAPAAGTQVNPNPIIEEPEPVTVSPMHKVASGDTLSKIAKANDTTVAAILTANPDIKNPNKISVGQDIVLPSAEPVEETAPVAAQGTGLMSPDTATADATETQETTASTATTVTDLIYSDFVDSKQEGDEAHVGQDSKNITLAGGVVPDGLVYDGKAHTQDKTKITNFDKSKLDTSGAYKKVGDKTIRRSDYDSDKAFAKGVIDEFTKRAKSAAGTSWDSMSDGSKKAVVKIGWNKGEDWYKRGSAKAIYAELAKDNPSPTNLYSKILAGSTVKGGGASIGIAKARANAWNETISATGGSEITKIVADNSGAKTHFKYYDKDGKLLYTEKTSRAPSIYENGTRLVSEKNAKGEW